MYHNIGQVSEVLEDWVFPSINKNDVVCEGIVEIKENGDLNCP